MSNNVSASVRAPGLHSRLLNSDRINPTTFAIHVGFSTTKFNFTLSFDTGQPGGNYGKTKALNYWSALPPPPPHQCLDFNCQDLQAKHFRTALAELVRGRAVLTTRGGAAANVKPTTQRLVEACSFRGPGGAVNALDLLKSGPSCLLSATPVQDSARENTTTPSVAGGNAC